MTVDVPRIAYLTAGAAGMYCGSCLRDNALVTALCRQGVDATLIPTYTPIRTDEADASTDRIFFGGINLYLQQRWPLFRRLPPLLDRWLDQPWLIRMMAGDGGAPSPRLLGEMTVSMLQGSHGNQRKVVERLVDWLQTTLRPDVINFTNLLIAGCVPELKRKLGVPIVVTLQGDDIFVDSLPDDYRRRTIERMQELAAQVDAFIVFNRFYADYMQQYLSLPADKFHIVPLGINLDDFRSFPSRPESLSERTPTIGYLARLAPEKGFHLLVDAFIDLRRQNPDSTARLLMAGWLGKQNRAYAEAQFAKLRAAGLQDAYTYLGCVDRAQKLAFLGQIDVLSVPTVYQDPKGLYVLEALAAGVPVVQPAHGSFVELLESTAGGCLVTPHDSQHLARSLHALLSDDAARRQLGLTGQANVAQRHSADAMARETLAVYRRVIGR